LNSTLFKCSNNSPLAKSGTEQSD